MLMKSEHPKKQGLGLRLDGRAQVSLNLRY
jgi:hypothetical protein